MERRNSYTRNVYVSTSAARIAIAKNNRESLILARTSKELSCECKWTVRSFYREKARANSFLQKVYEHGKNSRVLKVKWDENGNVTADKRIGGIAKSETRNEMKEQRVKLPSLDTAGKIVKAERLLQEFSLAGDTPALQPRNKLMGHLSKGRNTERSVKENPSIKESSEIENKNKTNATTPKLFKVRSRRSGICFSCSHFPSRSVNVSNTARKCSEEKQFNCPPWKSNETQFRKLSIGRVMLLDQKGVYEVNTPTLPSTGGEACT